MFGLLSCFLRTLAIDITIGRLVIDIDEVILNPFSSSNFEILGVTGKGGSKEKAIGLSSVLALIEKVLVDKAEDSLTAGDF
jgi:hypothetical protein